MKSFIILLIAIVSFTGCDKKLKNYDMLSASLSNKFKNHIQLKEEEVKGIYNLNTRLFKNVIINVDNENKSSEMYAIFELGSDYDSCIEEVEYFIEQYKRAWENNKQMKLVNNGIKEEIGNYIIYVVNENPNEIINEIKGFIK